MEYSKLESKRFGLCVFRGGVQTHIDPTYIKHFIEQNQVDVLIFRIHAQDQHQIYQIHRLGYETLVADTLVYYERALKGMKSVYRNTDLTFEFAQKKDQTILNQLTDDIFQHYTNHYFSNPNFDKQSIVDGYKEWALSHISQSYDLKQTDKLLWLIKKNAQYVGFTACKVEKANHTFNGVLNGIASHARRLGIYEDMIRFMCQYFEQRGFERMRISTQVQNYAVQKVWARNKFHMTQAYLTIHINAMLHQKGILKIDEATSIG